MWYRINLYLCQRINQLIFITMLHEQLFNASEQQLADFCQANINNKMQLTLKGQGNFQHISPVGLNICAVSVKIMHEIKYYYFGCIREHIYIELLYKFDTRHKRSR